MSRRGRIIAAVAVIAVVAAVLAYFALGSRGGGPEIETAEVAEKELAITVTASGKVETGVQADIYPPAQGVIDEIHVSDGATVTAGDPIATLETEPLELQVAQARAALSQAKAQLAAVCQQETGAADLTAARANVEATRQAYRAAKAQSAAVGDQAPSSSQIAAARAATQAARNAYENASDAYDAAAELSPSPSNDPTVTALAAARDQAEVAYLSARATENQLESTNLDAARAQARAGVAQAYAAWKGAEAQLDQLNSADLSAQREAAEAGVQQAAQALSAAEQALDDATMEAPIDGTVVFNDPGAAAAAAAAAGGAAGGAGAVGGKLAEGTAVSPQSPPFSVIDLDALKFTAEVDEADVARVAVGMNADITLDAFPGEEFASQVIRLNPIAQSTATGATVFEVEILLGDTGKDLLVGMKGDAIIRVSAREDAVTIPVEALFSEGGTDYVYVVENDRLNKTEITVGATTDTEVEVLSGLEPGETVALSGSTQYTDGMQVRMER